LYLDPNNYRFADEVENEKVDSGKLLDDRIQSKTRGYIEGEKRQDIQDLLVSFRTNGFLKVDVIQLKDLGSNNYLVIEGNRRVTALKCLQDDYKQGKDIGKLDPSVFQSVPAEIIQTDDDSDDKQLIIMGLKHISGNKKWPAINQAQLIYDYLKSSWGDNKIYSQKEKELCQSLGISMVRLRSSQRAIHLINEYKSSDYGDQFRSDMYSIFEEITKKNQIREWLEWSEQDYSPKNIFKRDRLFSWLSRDEKLVEDDSLEEATEREPIIDKASEIRDLADFIGDEEALHTMETTESVAIAYQKSGLNERATVEKAIDTVQKNINMLRRHSDILEDTDLEELQGVERGISSILPQKNSISLANKNIANFWNAGVNNHFSVININKYNKYRNFSIDNLSRINIFAGKNNTGKTTILEAIHLLCKQNDLNGLFDVYKVRKKTNEIFSDHLSEGLNDSIELTGVFNGVELSTYIEKYDDINANKNDVYLTSFKADSSIDGENNSMIIHTYEKGASDIRYEKILHLCNSYFSSPYFTEASDFMSLYNRAVEIKYDDHTAMWHIMQFVRQVDPSINGIEATLKNDIPTFVVDSSLFPEHTVELSSYGEGLVRIFEVALCIASCKNGVLLIDELETAIHYSMLVKYTKFIQEMAEAFNVQIFITTHSKECIDAFVKNNYKNEDISAYRLSDVDGEIVCKYVSGDKLLNLVDGMNFDIRGGLYDEN